MTVVPGVPESKPNPDPTVYTNDAIERATQAQRDYINGLVRAIETRLDAMDKATDLKRESINDIHDWMESSVAHLEQVMNEKFAGTDSRFHERDLRFDQKDRDDQAAVAAALGFQKELSFKQTEANQKALDKAEASTHETIEKNAQVGATSVMALSDKIDDLKERISRVESSKIGSQEQRIESRQSAGAVYAAVGFGITVLLGLLTVLGIVAANSP